MKLFRLIYVILAATLSSSYVYGQCDSFFQAGNSLLYKQRQASVRYSASVYIDTTFSCEEGVCFYGILRSGRSKPDVIDGFYNDNEFYFARLIRKGSGNGWKEVIHYHGACDEYDALGQFYGKNREYLGRFFLLK
ncbi:MAG: hypothetical protein AB8G05_18875 [Oligoflexales bacterium]